MRKIDVTVGKEYCAKVSGKLTYVKILGPCGYGGWYAKNTETGRQVRVRTAARLRHERAAVGGV